MGMDSPTTVFIPVHCATKKAPCPKCGKHGRRKRKLPPRLVRTVMYKKIAYLEITCGEYQARCDCCKTFRTIPGDVLPRARDDNKVRDLVLDRILKDGMNIEQTIESLSREFLLDLSTGFIYDVLRDHARELDMSKHRREVIERFSGTLCVDELHLGRFTLLLATDPLSDLPVAFERIVVTRETAGQPRGRPTVKGIGDESRGCVATLTEELGKRGMFLVQRSKPTDRELV